MTRPSPLAADELTEAAADGDDFEFLEELMGATDCPSSCRVEADGRCPHDFESAALTAGLI